MVTTTNGTAIPGFDYTPLSNTVIFADGEARKQSRSTIFTNTLAGNRTVGLVIVNPTNTIVSTPNTATLTIEDNSTSAGDIMFASTNYSVSELSGSVTINLIRTNGSTGEISVTALTTSGGTAAAGVDYAPTNVTVDFVDGQTNAFFTVSVLRNPLVTGNQTVNLTLTNISGTNGPEILPPSTVPLTILDADTGFAFDLPAYFVDETNGSITITVDRIGATNGSFTVQYATTNGTAIDRHKLYRCERHA